MLGRRSVVATGSLSLLPTSCLCGHAEAAPIHPGCLILGESASVAPACKLAPFPDDAQRILSPHIRNISRALGGTNPLVLTCDDPNNIASFQVDPSLEPKKSAVLISTGYIRNLLAPADTLKFAQLIGAFAHEFGHAAQLTLPCSGSVLSGGSYRVSNRKAISVLSGVALELHADFMAGWCVGRLGTLSDEQMDAFTDHSFDLGDELYWSPAHHGTPRDRTTMVNTGFNFATRGGQIDFRFGPQDKPDFYRSDPLGASLAGAYTLFTMGKVAPDLLLED